MAQGVGVKKRSDKFTAVTSKGKSKASRKNKPLGPRKGGHYIAPKKAKRFEADRKRKEITKQIGQHIEKAIHQQAVSEGNEFRILQNTPSTSSVPNPKKNHLAMSLGLLGEYGSDSSEENSPEHTHLDKSESTLSKTDSKAPYDPFGFNSPQNESSTSSSEQDNESESLSPPGPGQEGTLPLPDLEGPLLERGRHLPSSVFSNPYTAAEEEMLSMLKHHVKEFAPETKEKDTQRRRRKKNRGVHAQLNTRVDHSASVSVGSDSLYDEDDARLGRRKQRSGVGDSLVPAKKFMKLHSQIQAREKPWTRH